MYHDFSFELSLYYSLFFENKLCVLFFQVLQIREVKHVCWSVNNFTRNTFTWWIHQVVSYSEYFEGNCSGYPYKLLLPLPIFVQADLWWKMEILQQMRKSISARFREEYHIVAVISLCAHGCNGSFLWNMRQPVTRVYTW